MTLTFNPTPGPDAPISFKTSFSRLEAEFGDGYSQRAGNGINVQRKSLTLTWSTLTLSEKDTIKDFMLDHENGESFYYTLPGESVARKFIVNDMDETKINSTYYNFSVSLKEVFDI